MLIQKRIRTVFTISILLLILTFGISFYSFYEVMKKADRVEHTNLVLFKLEGILSVLKDAETGLRGYLLTEDAEFLEPYRGSYFKVLETFNEAKRLTRDNKSQQKKLDTLKTLINQRFAHIAKTIELEKSAKKDSALLLVSNGSGKKIMDNMRRVVGEMIKEELHLKKEQSNEVKASSSATPLYLLLSSFLSLIIAVFAFVVTNREINKELIMKKELKKAYVDLKEINEEFVRTDEHLKDLNSNLERIIEERTNAIIEYERKYQFAINYIPQFVWTCDEQGEAEFFNRNWLNYTGQSFEEAKEKGWTTILHPDDKQNTLEAWNAASQTGNEFKVEYRLRKYDGTYRWFLARAVRMKSSKTANSKWFGIATDIQDYKDVFEGLKQTKQELRERNKDLSEQNEKLQKINNDLDSFIYTASHDLKAPIANIEGLITILKKKDCYHNQESKTIIDMITTSSQRLKNVIEDLAVIIRIQNELDVDIEEIPVRETVEEVKLSISELISTSGAQINVACNECPTIKFSRRNFRSILFNLLSNAIKYGPPDRTPEIKIASARTDGYRILTVQDNGLGIEADKKDKIFSMFQRLHHHVEGSGIGLFIVKRIIDNSKGKIEVESERGKGTTFKVYFPEA